MAPNGVDARSVADPGGNLSKLFQELFPLGREEIVPAGSELWEEGSKADAVVLLVEGTVDVLHSSPSGEPVLLRAARPGDVLGEIACLDGGTRSASLRAATDCRIRSIRAAAFREFVLARPSLLEELFCIQTQRIRSLSCMVTQRHHSAITDQLTTLYNYGFFAERLDLELERALQMDDDVSIVLLDIDHFKFYNDTYGHPAGNTVLIGVADLLRNNARRGDIVARFGGEEFVILLYGASRKEAHRIAETARANVEATTFTGADTAPLGRVTISAGIGCFPTDAQCGKNLLSAADARLYDAKAKGRNRVESGHHPANDDTE